MVRTIERLEFDVAEYESQAMTVDPQTGDLLFSAVAVDKNRKPNRRGLVFDWKDPSDVHIEAFTQNPVMLFLHDSDTYPIGQWEEVNVNNKRVTVRGRIPNYSADRELAGYDEEVLAPIRGAVRNGLIRAVSIGFYIEEYEELGAQENGQEALRVLSFEIVEISVVPIGAHESALIKQGVGESPLLARLRAAVIGKTWDREKSKSDGRMFYRLQLDGPEDLTGICSVCGTRDVVLVFDDDHLPHAFCQGCLERLADSAWKAIPYARHGQCPRSAEETAWDGPAEMKKANVEQLPYMALFEDTNNPDIKGGYKLLHHQAAGDKQPPAIWHGIAAAMGVLLGARGGVKGVSDNEMARGYAHLKAHYADFDKPVPEFRQYVDDELKKLHAEGSILYPGLPDPAVEGEQQQPHEIDEIRQRLVYVEELLKAALDRAEDEDDEDDELPTASADAASPCVVLDAESVQLLRPVIRALLEADRDLGDLRSSLVGSVVDRLRRDNLETR